MHCNIISVQKAFYAYELVIFFSNAHDVAITVESQGLGIRLFSKGSNNRKCCKCSQQN